MKLSHGIKTLKATDTVNLIAELIEINAQTYQVSARLYSISGDYEDINAIGDYNRCSHLYSILIKMAKANELALELSND